MKNTYKLLFSEESLKGLQEIINYLEDKFSEKEVKNFAIKLDELIHLIKNNPESFPIVYNRNIRRVIINKRTSIFYFIDNSTIQILSIFDNRKNPKRLKRILKNK